MQQQIYSAVVIRMTYSEHLQIICYNAQLRDPNIKLKRLPYLFYLLQFNKHFHQHLKKIDCCILSCLQGHFQTQLFPIFNNGMTMEKTQLFVELV